MSDASAVEIETRIKAIEENQKRAVTVKQFLMGTVIFVSSIIIFQLLIL